MKSDSASRSVASRSQRIRLLWLALFVASVLLNAALLYSLHDGFSKLHFARVFPLGYVDQPQNAKTPSAAASIAVYGDSRALMWRRMDLPAAYDVINLGHGGQTSRQLLLQLQHEPAIRTKWSVVQIGINDLHPLGVLPNDREWVVSSLPLNIHAIAEELLSRSDYVILCTILPPARVPWLRLPLWDEHTLEYIEQTNHAIRAMDTMERVLVLDAEEAMRGSDSYLREEFEDPDFFLHLNAAGYSQLDRLLRDLLNKTSAARS